MALSGPDWVVPAALIPHMRKKQRRSCQSGSGQSVFSWPPCHATLPSPRFRSPEVSICTHTSLHSIHTFPLKIIKPRAPLGFTSPDKINPKLKAPLKFKGRKFAATWELIVHCKCEWNQIMSKNISGFWNELKKLQICGVWLSRGRKKTYQQLLGFISFMNYKGRCHYILLILCCCLGSGCCSGELRMSAAV